MVFPLDIVIVERLGSVKNLSVKDFKLEELYKKCGFKQSDGFVKQVEWSIKYDGKMYRIRLYAKNVGRANSENKYDFPPPVDNTLFYGNCALIASVLKRDEGKYEFAHLSVKLWDKLYEKLFGGFEDLDATAKEDEEEEDELEHIPKEKKTKQGYLKDGFVVDSDESESINELYSSEQSAESEEDNKDESVSESEDDNPLLDNIGSELSEDSYWESEL